MGASFTLSVLIVVFFAVALFPNDPPPAAALPTPAPEPAIKAPPTAPVAVRAEPLAAATEAPPRAVVRPASVATAPVRVAPASTRRAVGPRSAFTRVEEGETLVDVARRVYGSEATAGTLWQVNRDLIERPDAPLRPGKFLRTP